MVRLAINGYGRIGRCILRALYESGACSEFKVVAINEPANIETIAYLTKYDSTHGRFLGEVSVSGQSLRINDDDIAISHHEDLVNLPWRQFGIDVVLECSGTFTSRSAAQKHLDCGAKCVLFSQPADSDIKAIVYGINETLLAADDEIISAASCTSNALIPVINTMHHAFSIVSGIFTTIHSAMNDQPVLDAYHHTDLRKTRSASQSIIPVDTGLAAGIGRILPALNGKFSGHALRVPTVNVSAIDLVLQLDKSASAESVNDCLKDAVNGPLSGVMGYTTEPLASSDFVHNPHSAIVDGSQTRVTGQQAHILTWFDNEWGYANRMLDVLRYWFRTVREQ